MKNLSLKTVFTFLCAALFTLQAQAQFSGLLDKAKQKANDKLNQAMEKKANGSQPNGTANGHKIKINSTFDFKTCDSAIYVDDFSTNSAGKMPASWKTNGSGEIVKISEFSGKWLQLQSYASYKLTKLIKYPSKFTIEFDIVAVADKIADLNPLGFGFAGDNSVRGYLQDAYNDGAINNISLEYYNNRGIIEASSDTQYHHTDEDLDLQGFANQLMHVSIAVDGENEQVYLNKTKISDTKMFKPNRLKYFYISAPLQSSNGAKVLFGNFKLMGCK